jgi:hypothetical protein
MADSDDKRTPVKLRPILRKHKGKITEPYEILERLLKECDCFADVKDAAFRLYWRKDWQVDVDGVVIGAQVCKASERERLLAEEASESLDLQILLPEKAWPTLNDEEKEHRIFHELCHCRAARDSNGEQKFDSKDRPIWRLRRHPIVAFSEEIERFGIDRVVGHNASMVEAVESADLPLFANQADENGAARGNGKALAKTPIEALQFHSEKISDRQITLLSDAGLDTVGKLIAHMDEQKEWWHRGVKGIGKDSKGPIEDAVAAIQAANSEPATA